MYNFLAFMLFPSAGIHTGAPCFDSSIFLSGNSNISLKNNGKGTDFLNMDFLDERQSSINFHHA